MVVLSRDEIIATFTASLCSVGTAFTMAGAGMYLHERGYIGKEGKRAFALLSQQVTIPLLLFTKIVYCKQDHSTDSCPSVTSSMGDVWMILFWPLYVCSCGFLVGWLVAKACRTPGKQVRSVLAACGFGNSAGLVITLLAVIQENFPSDSEIGKIDPTAFLSMYLILYPVLLWGLGGWILSSEDEEHDEEDKDQRIELALEQQEHKEEVGEIVSNDNLVQSGTSIHSDVERQMSVTADSGGQTSTLAPIADLEETSQHQDASVQTPLIIEGTTTMTRYVIEHDGNCVQDQGVIPVEEGRTTMERQEGDELAQNELPISDSQVNAKPSTIGQSKMTKRLKSFKEDPCSSIGQTLRKICQECLQPPVIGALLGIFVTSLPSLRGIFVDMVTRSSNAPLQWFFDGLYNVGLAAVPINMIILGCNLSASNLFRLKNCCCRRRLDKNAASGNNSDDESSVNSKENYKTSSSDEIDSRTVTGIVIGKMIIMPIIGIASCVVLKNYVWHIPEEINAPFFLVLMLVFVTPTANNVMIMVELSGSASKEGMARIIGLQYMCAPVLLSLSVSGVVYVTSQWMQ